MDILALWALKAPYNTSQYSYSLYTLTKLWSSSFLLCGCLVAINNYKNTNTNGIQYQTSGHVGMQADQGIEPPADQPTSRSDSLIRCAPD